MAILVFAAVGLGLYLRNTREAEPGLADLPEGVIAQAAGRDFTQKDIDAHLSRLPEKQREIASKDLEGALEQVIEKELLLTEAEKLPKEAMPDTQGKSPGEKERALLDALEAHVIRDVKVAEEEIQAYYEEHKAEYKGQPGGSYEEMHESIERYLRYDLAEAAFREYKEEVITRAQVEKDREWVRDTRANVKDPLVEARASGKVVIADFGRGI
jgi:hypothetical protein